MDNQRQPISKTLRLAVLLALTTVFLPCYCFGNRALADTIVRDSVVAEASVEKAIEANKELDESINRFLEKADSLNLNDSISKIMAAVDSLNLNDSISKMMAAADSLSLNDSLAKDTLAIKKVKRDWTSWRPNAKRAMWLALVIPGAGQIYNRKFWKLPIVYGGFLGCLYAIRWNNQMYRDYSQAYMDIMDNDPSTQSYNQFLHLGATITDDNTDRYQSLFKKRKDYYRKYRDLSIFCLIGVYALSVIDAYVDAALSEFDISRDLSLKVEPAVINNNSSVNPLKASSLGLQCYLNF